MTNEAIIETIYTAVDEVNQFRPAAQRLEKSPDTVLLGKGGQLDSLDVVNLIVATEMNVEQEFGVSVNLADDKAMAQENSPFRTIGTFAQYIDRLLSEKRNNGGSDG